MASFKAKFPVLQELFAKNHRGGPLGPPPSGARVKTAPVAAIPVNPYFRSKSAEHDVTLTSFVAEL